MVAHKVIHCFLDVTPQTVAGTSLLKAEKTHRVRYGLFCPTKKCGSHDITLYDWYVDICHTVTTVHNKTKICILYTNMKKTDRFGMVLHGDIWGRSFAASLQMETVDIQNEEPPQAMVADSSVHGPRWILPSVQQKVGVRYIAVFQLLSKTPELWRGWVILITYNINRTSSWKQTNAMGESTLLGCSGLALCQSNMSILGCIAQVDLGTSPDAFREILQEQQPAAACFQNFPPIFRNYCIILQHISLRFISSPMCS